VWAIPATEASRSQGERNHRETYGQFYHPRWPRLSRGERMKDRLWQLRAVLVGFTAIAVTLAFGAGGASGSVVRPANSANESALTKIHQASQTAQVAAHAALASPTIPTGKEQICLTSSNGACVGFPVQDVVQDVIAAAGVAAAWVAIFFQWISKGKGDGGQEGEEKDTGDADNSHHDPDAGLCLAQTDPNPITGYTGNTYMTKCSANGTVWIAVRHGNGYWLVNRWWYNQGIHDELLSVGSTKRGSHVFVSPPGGYVNTWNWYSTSHK
jgi:hypothetical protein